MGLVKVLVREVPAVNGLSSGAVVVRLYGQCVCRDEK